MKKQNQKGITVGGTSSRPTPQRHDPKNQKGITLVALVITIIVLLILAGVTLAMLTGEEGIIKSAKEAEIETRGASVEEQRDIWLAERYVQKTVGTEQKTMDEILNELLVDGLLSAEEVAIIKNDENNEITIGSKTISFNINHVLLEAKVPKGAITFGEEVIWENGKAKVTVHTTTEYIIQYQINEKKSDSWTEITNGGTITDLVHNDIVYARLWDKTIETGTQPASIDIKDEIAPIVSIEASNVGATNVTLIVTASDGQTGLAETKTYKYYLNGLHVTTLETNSYNFTELEPETVYTLGVIVVDSAGNESILTTKEVTTLSVLLAKRVQVGDYVAYDATGSHTYTSPAGSGTSHGNGNSSQKFTSSSSIKWRVLSINSDTGELVLVSEAPIGSLTLKGAIGFLYAEEELNTICSIYGKGVGANTSKSFTYKVGDEYQGYTTKTLTESGARSINMDDINKVTGYVPATVTKPYTNTTYYPTLKTSSGVSSSYTSMKYSHTYYYYNGSKYLATDSVEYKMLYRNVANTAYSTYWIGTRFVYSHSTGAVNYYVQYINDSGADWHYLFHGADPSLNYAYAYGIRPVVFLKPTVETTGQDSNGAWTIIDE